MHEPCRRRLGFLLGLLAAGCVICLGCGHLHKEETCPDAQVPRELRVVSLPPYVIEPPDILLIDAVRVIPKPPYRVEPLDALAIQAKVPEGFEPVAGIYGVDTEGNINLGVAYSKVQVAGLTLEQVRELVTSRLKERIKNPQVTVALAQARGRQQIRGDHLVRPDGTVGLGIYGSVLVSGLTLQQAKYAIEQHLSKYLQEPEISLDIYSYNSKFYYVIYDGAGYGQQIFRLPVTGKETVLDAISQVYGLRGMSSTKHLWVARPNGGDPCKEQILPVDWQSVVRCGSPATNYQLLPGDRVYVQSDPLIRTNNILTKAFAPLERVFGITLLGNSTVQSIESTNLLFSTGVTGQGVAGPLAATR